MHLDCAPTQAEPPSDIRNHMARTNIENFKVALPGYLLLACMFLVGTKRPFRCSASISEVEAKRTCRCSTQASLLTPS